MLYKNSDFNWGVGIIFVELPLREPPKESFNNELTPNLHPLVLLNVTRQSTDMNKTVYKSSIRSEMFFLASKAYNAQGFSSVGHAVLLGDPPKIVCAQFFQCKSLK